MRAQIKLFGLVAVSLLALSACGGGNDDGGGNFVCGNDTCESGETEANCPADCGPAAECGNGTCEAGEDAASCAADCGTTATCGNGTCETGEDAANCAADCGTAAVCGNGTCETGETAASCAADCASSGTCGNGTCEAGETLETCAADCFTCDMIPPGTGLGQSCAAADACGTGGACLDFGEGGQCYQVCVPGKCTETCTGDQACMTVTDQSGNTIEWAPGLILGACDVPPTGATGAYDACNAEPCNQGLSCLGLQNFPNHQPLCMPGCTVDADCPAKENVAGSCSLGSGTDKYCVLLCDVASPTCPTGMECADTNQGTGVCMIAK